MSAMVRKINWLVPSLNFDHASVRFRCFYFSCQLQKDYGYVSTFSKSTKEFLKKIQPKDVVIICKILSQDLIPILAKAREIGCLIIYDVTDNVGDPAYKGNEFSINNYLLGIIIDFADLIFVPTNAMRNSIIESQLYIGRDLSQKIQDITHTIPDIAETKSNMMETIDYIRNAGDKTISIPKDKSIDLLYNNNDPERNNLLWFGNAYSPTSNMGLSSLTQCIPILKKLQRDYKFNLLICTAKDADTSILKDCGINFTVSEWSSLTIFNEFKKSFACLITTGNDTRCKTKSNNRAIMSLANDCPVIRIGSIPNMEELEEVSYNNIEKAVQDFYLSKNKEANIKNNIIQAQDLLKRFMPKEVAKCYKFFIEEAQIKKYIKHNTLDKNKTVNMCIGVICDELSIEELKHINKIHKKIPSIASAIFCHINIKPGNLKIEFYAKNNIIPYLFQEFTIKECRVLHSCNWIVVSSNTLRKEYKFIDVITHFFSSYQRYGDVEICSFEDFDALINQTFNPSTSCIDNFSEIFVPENVPGKNKPKLPTSENLDLLFITSLLTRNWILDGIAKEIGSRGSLNWATYYTVKGKVDIPKAKVLFFMHADILLSFDRKNTIDYKNTKVFCWYTHPKDEDPAKINQLLIVFQRINKVVFTCNANMKLWIKRGLAHERCACIIGGYDHLLFSPHNRSSSNLIGICSSFYERKDPMLLTNIVHNKLDKRFILLGKNWENFSYFNFLMSSGNISYETAPYSDYPYYYSKMSVFLSTSKLEGGPIPLLEAMASNCIPVATNTGFASDLIKHESNGYLFNSNESLPTILEYIDLAYADTETDISSTVVQFSWEHFSRSIHLLID